jgi:hypothetical protein
LERLLTLRVVKQQYQVALAMTDPELAEAAANADEDEDDE